MDAADLDYDLPGRADRPGARRAPRRRPPARRPGSGPAARRTGRVADLPDAAAARRPPSSSTTPGCGRPACACARPERRRGRGAPARAARRRLVGGPGAPGAEAPRRAPGCTPRPTPRSPWRSATTSATAAGGSRVGGTGRGRRRGAAAALHPRAARRPRALPDRVRPPAGVGRRAHRRAPPHRRRARRARRPGRARRRSVELVVGLDTFRPIAADRVEDHPMHSEAYAVPAATLAAVEPTRRPGGGRRRRHHRGAGARVGAGHRRAGGPHRRCSSGPASAFRAVDRLLTNFHVPRTTLLALVAAFAGDRWRDLYDEPWPGRYRFLSFGDAMLLTRHDR